MSNLLKCAQNFGITIAQPKKIEIQSNKREILMDSSINYLTKVAPKNQK